LGDSARQEVVDRPGDEADGQRVAFAERSQPGALGRAVDGEKDNDDFGLSTLRLASHQRWIRYRFMMSYRI